MTEEGILLTINEYGVAKEYKEPYCTIECQTEEDYNMIADAVIKQFDKKPIMLAMEGFDAEVASHLCCPNCKQPIVSQFIRDYKPKYCSECGQRLDWSEVNNI